MRLILFADKLFLFNFEGPIICPRGWILWNSMCYYFSSDSLSTKLSWQEALQACRSTRGGDLVSIHSASENIFIKSKIIQWVVFKMTSHWFFKQCLFTSVYTLSDNFQSGDVLAFERGNTTLCHSTISFRYVQLFLWTLH